MAGVIDIFVELPLSHRRKDVVDQLSANGQLYLACAKCTWEDRVSPAAAVEPRTLLRLPCPRCHGRKRRFVRHLVRVPARCEACGRETTFETVPWKDRRCPNCLSAKLALSDVEVVPPFPAVFGELDGMHTVLGPGSDKAHPWGVSGKEDARRVRDEVKAAVQLYPDPQFHTLIGAIFLRDLRSYCDYEDDAGYTWILQLEGLLLQDYFRQTGDIPAGPEAVRVDELATASTKIPALHASLEHNRAMATYSLPAR